MRHTAACGKLASNAIGWSNPLYKDILISTPPESGRAVPGHQAVGGRRAHLPVRNVVRPTSIVQLLAATRAGRAAEDVRA